MAGYTWAEPPVISVVVVQRCVPSTLYCQGLGCPQAMQAQPKSPELRAQG